MNPTSSTVTTGSTNKRLRSHDAEGGNSVRLAIPKTKRSSSGTSRSSSSFLSPSHAVGASGKPKEPHALASRLGNSPTDEDQHCSSATEVVASIRRGKLQHNFKANFNDHFETTAEALRDLLPAVLELRQLTRPSAPERFVLYDPYYCAGTVAQLWRELGIANVLHENRDFYADSAQNTLPGPYDLLVTNPPFSEDHLPRLLEFLAKGRDDPSGNRQRPWAFLAPDYIAAKPWYRAWVQAHFESARGSRNPKEPFTRARPLTDRRSDDSQKAQPPQFEIPPFLKAQQAEEKVNGVCRSGDSAACRAVGGSLSSDTLSPEPFYIVPKGRYDFRHPVNAGHEHSHFKSMWFVWMGSRTPEIIRASKIALVKANASSSTISGSPATIVHGLQALDEGQYVSATEKRLNPKQRRRVHSKKY